MTYSGQTLGLGNVFPFPAMDNTRNRRATDSIFLGQCTTRSASCPCLPDSYDLGVSQASARVCFAGRYATSPFLLPVSDIFLVCANKKMGRVEAARVIAVMQYVQVAIEVEPKPKHGRDAVYVSLFAFDPKMPVTSRGRGTFPVPATGFRGNISARKKPDRKRGSIMGTHRRSLLRCHARAVTSSAGFSYPLNYTTKRGPQ